MDPKLVAREYGYPGEARQLFEDAKGEGIVFLDEGTYRFKLDNGAALTVYASPYTPALGAWGFQYHPNHGRKFDIQKDTDIVMTHGPPRGIMDFTYGRERSGCPDLFRAVAEARPRIHCFGHIHEDWGARLVTWKDSGIDKPSHFTAIENEKSSTVETLDTIRSNRFDSDETIETKRMKLRRLSRDKCSVTSHRTEDAHPIEKGKATFFVNAALMGQEKFTQRPWLVDIELPKCTLT